MLKWAIALLGLAVVFAGCSSQRHHVKHLGGSDNARLERGAALAIATPEDGRHEARVYGGSGAQTAVALQAAFAQYTNATRLVSDCAALDCLRSVAGDARYLVVPRIVNWEDKWTAWGGADRLQVQVAVYDTQGVEVTSALVESEEQDLLLGTEVEDLLEELFQPYVLALYEGR